jgi:DNA invertase Pin-like site-specific DNA recombinase
MSSTEPAPKHQRPACVVHCRVSTAKQAYQGESLETQASICTAIAEARGWALAHEPWKESFSGRKEQRPVFEEVLAFLDAHPGKVRYYLFRTIDRMTRGGSFSYEQMKRELGRRGVELVDSLGIIQPTTNTLSHVGFEYGWSRFSPSEISELVVATTAKHEVTTILTRLIGEEISLRQQGYKVRQPADGFANTKILVGGKKRVIEVPDPERAKYFIAMFEMRASGQFTDVEICTRVNAMGYRGRVFNRWDEAKTSVTRTMGGKPLTTKHLQAVVQRPIYCGIICEKWTRWLPIKAAYDGLVSIETFNAANRGKIMVRQRPDATFEITTGSGKLSGQRSRENALFPLRKVIVCPTCRKPFLGSSPRGRSGQRFPTYHCARSHKYFGVPKAEFEKNVRDFVEGSSFRLEVVPILHARAIELFHEQEAIVEANANDARRSAAELAARKSEAVKSFKHATTDAMRRGLEAEVEEIERELESATSVEAGLRISRSDIDAYVEEATRIMEHPSLLLENPANAAQLESLYALTFDELPSYAEIINRTANWAWIFRSHSDFDETKSNWVRPTGLKWNQVEDSVLRWKASKTVQSLIGGHAAVASLKS